MTIRRIEHWFDWKSALLRAAFGLWLGCSSLSVFGEAEIVLLLGQGERRMATESNWLPAAVKQRVAAGGFVRTLANSQMGLLLADRSQVRLNQNSQMQIKTVAEAGEWRATQLQLNSGRAWSQARPATAPPAVRDVSRVSMETPSVTLSIRGTDWDVEVGGDGNTIVQVYSGTVDMKNTAGSLRLAAGERASVAVGQAPVRLQVMDSRQRVQWVSLWTPSLRRLAGEMLPAYRDVVELSERGAYHEALASLDRTPDTAGLRDVLGADLLATTGEYALALARLPVDSVVSQAPEVLCLQARLLARVDRLADGRVVLQRGLTRYPDDVVLLGCTAELAILDGDLRIARQALAAALVRQPERAETWLGLGIVAAEREELSEGRSALAQAAKDAVFSGRARGEWGTLETLSGDPEQGAVLLATRLQEDPADFVAHTAMGINWLKRGQPAEALESLLRAGTIAPRYARAWIYSGVAFYQLGERERALQAFQRASELDMHDPVPYFFRSVIALDALELGLATRYASEAMQRLPYLKSLNQVALDQRGSVGNGSALAFFGLDDWSKTYAFRGYGPVATGSHFVLASRLPGAFGRNAALLQGYLADPLAIGAANRFSPLIAGPGHYGSVETYVERYDWRQASLIGTVNGRFAGTLPVAYYLSGDLATADMRANASAAEANNGVASLGVRLSPSLSAFGFFSRYDLSGELDNDLLSRAAVDVGDRRADFGLHFRPGAGSELWLKAGNGSRRDQLAGGYRPPASLGGILQALGLPANASLPLNGYQAESQLKDVQVRQSWRNDDWAVSVGFESAQREQPTRFQLDLQPFRIDSVAARKLQTQDAYLEAIWQGLGSLELTGGIYWQRAKLVSDDASDLLLIAMPELRAEVSREQTSTWKDFWHPRLGVRWDVQPGTTLRLVGQRWLRPAGVNSLVPVATAGVPVNDELVTAGGRYSRLRGQLEQEIAQYWFGMLSVDHERIDNVVLGPPSRLVDIDVGQLDQLRVRREFFSPRRELEDVPIFPAGRLTTLEVSNEFLLGDRQSAAVRYRWRNQEQSGVHVGQFIPYVPRHWLDLSSQWALPGRWLFATTATYRSGRFTDPGNLHYLSPGWHFGGMLYWESDDKHHGWQCLLDNLSAQKKSLDIESSRFVFRYSYRF